MAERTAVMEREMAPAPADPDARVTHRRRSIGRPDWATWPRYEQAVMGWRNYWYPVAWSRKVGRRRSLGVMVCGFRVWLRRRNGTLTAAIRSGSEAKLHRIPSEERLGIVWVFIGDGDPPPVERDMPSELLADDAVVLGRLTVRPGNWRFGAENGFDEGHAKFLHRRSLWTLRRQMPTWVRHHIESTGEGWITRIADEVHYDTPFPGLGWWPPHRPWRTVGRGKATVSIRLPCFLRVAYAPWQHYEWWVPIDAASHTYLQLVSKRAGRLERIRFTLYYRLWVRWVFHGLFNDEDALMVDVMDAPPERLYRPDIAITEWRRLCEADTRGAPINTTPETADNPIEQVSTARRVGLPITHRVRELIGR